MKSELTSVWRCDILILATGVAKFLFKIIQKEGVFMEFVIMLACIAVLVLDWFVAKWFAEAARAKGWKDKKYFWICFFLTGIGYLLVIALPDRDNGQFMEEDELPDL